MFFFLLMIREQLCSRNLNYIESVFKERTISHIFMKAYTVQHRENNILELVTSLYDEINSNIRTQNRYTRKIKCKDI